MLKNYSISLMIICFFLIQNHGKAQGIHFSYLEFAPQHVNPANIGGFLGSYRGSAIYRDQYNSDGVRGYKDFEIGIDLPAIRGLRKQDWIGVGISVNNDARGTVKLNDRYSRIGLSYHLGLDAKQTRIFTVGLQMIGLTRKLNTNITNGVTPEGILTGRDTELMELLKGADQDGNKTISARDWNLGVQFSTKSLQRQLKIGASVSGVLPSALGFSAGVDSASVPFKVIGHIQLVNQLSKTMTLEPTAIVQVTEYGGTEFMANAKIGYQIQKDKKIKGGLGFRTGTLSAIFFLGAEIKDINFGLSYDLPLTGYAGSPGIENGFEFGASYIGVFKKTPKPTPVIICPRL
jgi:type IX secretion system PorP/SprF family membrane protein